MYGTMTSCKRPAQIALTLFQGSLNNSMSIIASTAYVSVSRVLKTETAAAEVKSIKNWLLTSVAFSRDVLSFLFGQTSQRLSTLFPTSKADPQKVQSADVSVAVCSLTTYSKTRVRVSLVWMMSWSSTMLECFRPFRRDAAETEQTDS